MSFERGDPPIDARSAADTTTRLMARAQAGDADALNDLFSRHVPLLSRWARGRLPGWARDLADTHDLVQETVLQTFKNVQGFESRGKGALRAYLRQVRGLLQALIDRVRVAVAADATLEETQRQVTLADWKTTLAGDDPAKQRAFDVFVLQPGVERAWRQARGEPDK